MNFPGRVTAEDLADELGIKVETVWWYNTPSARLKRKRPQGFPTAYPDGRNVYFLRSEVDAYLAGKAVKVAA